jgi:hypothetical protein
MIGLGTVFVKAHQSRTKNYIGNPFTFFYIFSEITPVITI